MKKILFTILSALAFTATASAQSMKVYQNGELKAIYYVSKDDKIEFSEDFPFPGKEDYNDEGGSDNDESGSNPSGGGNGQGGNTNNHDYVDLGLSVKWATCNVGAVKPEGYGNYYSWGETETKSSYYSTDYFDNNKVKYFNNGGMLSLEAKDDVAHVQWGGSWRMPTVEEMFELIENCSGELKSQNGVVGIKMTSKKNGNSIFLPAAGYYDGSRLYDSRSYGYYWASDISPDDSDNAYSFYFGSSYLKWDCKYRPYGCSVRPVCP